MEDLDSLLVRARAVYRRYEERGPELFQAASEGRTQPIAVAADLANLFPELVAKLRSEGASPYQALLATEAARIAWHARRLKRVANLPIGERQQALATAVATSLTEGPMFTRVVANIVRTCGKPEAEVSMYLRQLIESLSRQADTTSSAQ